MESSDEDEPVPGTSDLFGDESDSDSGPEDLPRPSKGFLESSSESEPENEPPMKKRIISDDEQEDENKAVDTSESDPEEPAKEQERSEDEKEIAEDPGNEPLMLDFDIMMQKKKEENRKLHNKRRKTKDIDMINDNDDAIAKLMADMRMAAHEDREHNQKVINDFYRKIGFKKPFSGRASHEKIGHVKYGENVHFQD